MHKSIILRTNFAIIMKRSFFFILLINMSMQHIKHNYIITRFSIFDYNFKGFNITKDNTNNIEKYKSILFDHNRLDFKFNVFQNMTYQSIMNQTDKNFTWLIYTSIFLPDYYKNKLENIIYSPQTQKSAFFPPNEHPSKPTTELSTEPKSHFFSSQTPQIKLIYVDNFKSFLSDIPKHIHHQLFTTIRLDDDDGLNKNFIKIINSYDFKENCGKIISFPKGIEYTINSTKLSHHVEDKNFHTPPPPNILYGKQIFYPLNAMGMCGVGMLIFNCGDHTQVGNKYEVIYNDTLNDAYYMCCSEYCDTKRKFSKINNP